jgi:hypothetical protein
MDGLGVIGGALVGAWARPAQAAWPARLLAGIVGATGLLALALTGRSLSWPMAHDAPLMHYGAWLIRRRTHQASNVLEGPWRTEGI